MANLGVLATALGDLARGEQFTAGFHVQQDDRL